MLTTHQLTEESLRLSPVERPTGDAYLPKRRRATPGRGGGGGDRRGGNDWQVTLGLVFLDLLAWVAIYAGAAFMRGGALYTTPLQIAVIEALQFAVTLGAIFVIGGYNRTTDMRGLMYLTEHVMAVVIALGISSLLVYSAATFDRTMKPSRAVLLGTFLAFLPVSLIYRRAISKAVWATTAHRAFLVVGAGPDAAEFYQAYKKAGNRERLEFVDLERQRIGEHIAGPGSPTIEGDLATKLARLDTSYSGVIVAERLDRIKPELLELLVRTQFYRTRVYTMESFHETQWRYVPVHAVDPFWPLQRGFQLARNSPYHYVKRLFDVVASLVLLLVAAPVSAVIALAIWFDDGWPSIFRQSRVGRDNEPFMILKFRTMRMRADADAGDMYTRRSDPRITRVGRGLRKLRLDELPQLWNVLRGEMSLIGPRAEWVKCVERYEEVIPFYHFRHLVKPGITGWAQVNYPYGESDKDAIEKLKYDLYYIRNYSLKLDLMIALKTVHTIIFGKGQ